LPVAIITMIVKKIYKSIFKLKKAPGDKLICAVSKDFLIETPRPLLSRNAPVGRRSAKSNFGFWNFTSVASLGMRERELGWEKTKLQNTRATEPIIKINMAIYIIFLSC